jgi:hypothetical protein
MPLGGEVGEIEGRPFIGAHIHITRVYSSNNQLISHPGRPKGNKKPSCLSSSAVGCFKG